MDGAGENNTTTIAPLVTDLPAIAPWNIAVVGVAYALTGVSFFIILSRMLLRRMKHEAYLIDDFVMLASLGIYIVFTAVSPVAFYNGASIAVVDPGQLSPDQIRHVILGSQFILVGRPFLLSYLWTMKACILIFYTRLTDRIIEVTIIRIAGIFVGITWLACMFSFFLECNPLPLAWQVLPEVPGCTKAVSSTLILAGTDIATNVILIAIPLPIIIRGKFEQRTIFQIIPVFLGALFIIAIITTRIVIVTTISSNSANWQSNLLIWGQVECFLTTCVANAPILYRLWRHGFNHIRKGKFGMDACSTGYTPPVENQNPRSEVHKSKGKTKMGTFGRGLRSSAARIQEKARRSIEGFKIETKIELLQHTKTGTMEPFTTHEEEGHETFGGLASSSRTGPRAQIDTTVVRTSQLSDPLADWGISHHFAKKWQQLRQSRTTDNSAG
ncbi:hypothetical protein BGZ60DRAFT_524302 [Tricladium varicosporioides]|nr:hypothetical protein BGZ60DRAFT_524302 [Hymenoscyphus varicosporioides]